MNAPVSDTRPGVYFHYRPGDVDPFYVGKGAEKRARNLAPSARSRNPHHANITKKYGRENIRIRYRPCRSEKVALKLEKRLIRILRGRGIKLVNLTDGGDGISGYRFSPEARAKISAASRGNTYGKNPSPETREKLAAAHRGRVHTQETRAKISAANRGKVLTQETREKLAAANRGKPKSPEARAKMLGKNPSPETRAKMSAAQQGRKPASPETRAKISAANRGNTNMLGKTLSPETRAKIGAAGRGRRLVTKGRVGKMVPPAAVPMFLDLGWMLGRKSDTV